MNPETEKPDSEVIDKIEKLLNLAARAGTEGEATAAFAAASKLMTKYGIEKHRLGQKKEDDGKPKFERVTINKKWRTERPAHLYVRQVIRACFNVSVVKIKGWDGISYFMIGTREDCAFAAYAFDVLCDTFLRLQNDYLRIYEQPRTPSVYQSYFNGLAHGYIQAWKDAQAEQIRASGAQSYAIVLVDKDKALTAFINSPDSGVQQKAYNRGSSGHAFACGVKDGKTIKVNHALQGGAGQGAIQ